jgi:hypothetical protein
MALGLVGLIVVAGFIVPPACGCASTPTRPPGWTPWPVSRDRAVDTASRLTDSRIERSWTYERTISGRPMYQAKGLTSVAYVDANSGAVLEAIIGDQLPDTDSTPVSIGSARSAAESFLAHGGVDPTGLAEAAQLTRRASVAFYDVTWTGGGAAKSSLEVFVNTSSGRVFAYRDLRSGLELAVPVIGPQKALRLAGESSSAKGETPYLGDSNEPFQNLYDSFDTADAHQWRWEVNFPDGSMEVDAETGAVSVTFWR